MHTESAIHDSVGIVAIGRNEGERLKKCLISAERFPLVYVDSGSTDGSLDFANNRGAICVSLDMSQPFTAARARNSGFKALLNKHPQLKYVMFVDGDCEIAPNWISAGSQFLDANPDYAVTCGRRRERNPGASIYNQLCDIEWDTPVGDAQACGGDALYRVSVFCAVQGFDDTFIAGEEPELCFRIRQLGHKIMRMDHEMTLHDADMTRAAQWWKRTKRSGYAYFLNHHKHSKAGDTPFKRKELRSIVGWNALLGGSLLLATAFKTLLPILAYVALTAVQTIRMERRFKSINREHGANAARLYAASITLGKVPQFAGVLEGYVKTLRNTPHTLVEYK